MFDWVRIRYIISVITSNFRMAFCNRGYCSSSWINVAILLNKSKKESVCIMQIVVKKVPKFLRGFVKLIFRIKE